MRVKLKGLNRVRKRLADGRMVEYWYPWKGQGAPRLEGKPGSPEFVRSYEEAYRSNRKKAPAETVQFLLDAYQQSGEFKKLADRTRTDYIAKIRQIETKFGSFPIAALSDRRTRGVFLSWRDELAQKSKRQADYTLVVFGAVLSWALGKRGLISDNPIEKYSRLYDATRAESIWTLDKQAAFLKHASPQVRLAFLMALYTGQRPGDLLRLTWTGYDAREQKIHLRQSKTGVLVVIDVEPILQQALKAAPKTATTIITNVRGQPFTSPGFSKSFRATRDRAVIDLPEIQDLTFNDLRGTAITRWGLMGWKHSAIARQSGHSLRDVQRILDDHYISRELLLGDGSELIEPTVIDLEKAKSGTDFSN